MLKISNKYLLLTIEKIELSYKKKKYYECLSIKCSQIDKTMNICYIFVVKNQHYFQF